MGIVEDYLNAPTDEPKKTAPIKSSGIIERYLDAEGRTPDGRLYVSPQPPISGFSKEDSDALNARTPIKGGPQSQLAPIGEGIKNLVPNIISDSVENFKDAGGSIGAGMSDIVNNQPASGVGKIALGGLAGLSAIPAAIGKNVVEEPITQITGNPDIGERAGMVAGIAAPVIPATSAVIKAIPKNKALSSLVADIGQDNLPAVVQGMKDNPRLTPADLSPNVRQTTQGLFIQGGPQTDYLHGATNQRLATAKGAAQDIMDQSLGKMVDPVAKLAELKQNIKDVGAKQINPAVAGAKPVDLSGTIKYIDDRLKPGINSVVDTSGGLPSTEVNQQLGQLRKLLTNDKVTRTDAQTLHNFQSVMRGEAEGLIKKGGQDARVGNAMMGVRNKIVDAIDEASGGKYKPALSNYRDEYHIQDAFRHGHDEILRNGGELEDRPEFYEKYLKGLTKEELNAEREGARIKYDTQLNGFRSAATNPTSKVTNIGDVEFNRRRATALFGKEEADTMFKKFQDEKNIADTNNKLVQGSQTAMRMAAEKRMALPEKTNDLHGLVGPAIAEGLNIGGTLYAGGGLPGAGLAAYYGLKGAASVKDAIALKLAREHGTRYAKYALPQSGPERDALIQQLDAIAKAPPKQSILRRTAGTLSKIVQP